MGDLDCEFFNSYDHSAKCFICRERYESQAELKCTTCGISIHSSCIGCISSKCLQFRCDVCMACGIFVEHGTNVTRLLFSENGINIYIRNLLRLCPGGWIDDEIIGLYMSDMIQSYDKANRGFNCACVNSFFIPLLISRGYVQALKSLTHINLADIDSLVFPIHGSAHWTLAIYNKADNTIDYYDSLGGNGSKHTKPLQMFFTRLNNDTQYQSLSELPVTIRIRRVAKQSNLFDCGLYICMYLECFLNDQIMNFTALDIYNLRLRLVRFLLLKRVDEM